MAAKGAVGDGLGGVDGHLALEGDFVSSEGLLVRGRDGIFVGISASAAAAGGSVGSSSAALTTTATFMLVRFAEIEARHVHDS